MFDDKNTQSLIVDYLIPIGCTTREWSLTKELNISESYRRYVVPEALRDTWDYFTTHLKRCARLGVFNNSNMFDYISKQCLVYDIDVAFKCKVTTGIDKTSDTFIKISVGNLVWHFTVYGVAINYNS
jgi:hypothetical protein